LALHWSSVIVAVVLGLGAIAAYAKARAGSMELTPGRTIHQVNKDIAVAKEQFSCTANHGPSSRITASGF
jgi:curli biogenesis system outer membrane secretion channel CsgG